MNLKQVASGTVSITNTDGFPQQANPSPKGKVLVNFDDGSSTELVLSMKEFLEARKAAGFPDLFKCVSVSRDSEKYGLPTATFQRCDGIAGEIVLSGSYLMELDSPSIKEGDQFTIQIKPSN